jgi:hypothetical protein
MYQAGTRSQLCKFAHPLLSHPLLLLLLLVSGHPMVATDACTSTVGWLQLHAILMVLLLLLLLLPHRIG